MTLTVFTVIVFVSSGLAGILGALTGLGGGVVIVPLLALAMHVDLRYAMGASLISVIATSSGAASAYVREGYSNIRVGMFLEIATTLGAIGGAWLSARTPKNVIAIVFGAMLIYSGWSASRPRKREEHEPKPDYWAERLRLDGSFPEGHGMRYYNVRHLPFGFALMSVAGMLSGLLGIGSGAFKVLAMDKVMKIPFKVSTTTSNFMIGVTAAASVGLYLHRGYIDPALAMPVMLGVLIGSTFGARVLIHARVSMLRVLFGVVIALLGLQMIYSGATGKL